MLNDSWGEMWGHLQYQTQGLWCWGHWWNSNETGHLRLNEHGKSVLACDLKSTVSEHTKHAGHSINWASVKIIGQEDHPAFMQDTWGHKHSYSATGNKPWSGLQPSPTYGTILQPHSFKRRLQITANVITDEGMWLGSERCAKFSTNCWCWKIWWWWWWNFIKVSKEAP